MIITLDGPAGAGKSSTARRLADRLGWCYMDTGAMYRAVALAALDRGLPLTDQEGLAGLVAGTTISFSAGRVLLDGRDVSREIRTDRVTAATRPVADAPPVREAMKRLQRAMAERLDVVTEGRDQGTVVFPDAAVKFFLDAAPEVRARRRQLELAGRGEYRSYREVLGEVADRDRRDTTRQADPLRVPRDAVRVDTTDLDVEAMIGVLEGEVRRRMKEEA